MAFHGIGNTLKPLAFSKAYLPYHIIYDFSTAAFRWPPPISDTTYSPVPLRPVIGVTVSLVGRDPHDYNWHSVTLWVAPRRQSRIPYRRNIRLT